MMALLTGLVKATRFCRQDEAFCEGVTFHQFMILDALADGRAFPMSGLHEKLAVAKSTTTRLINPLIEKRLVQRRKNPLDARAIEVYLTPKGKKIHDNVRLCLSEFLGRVAGHLPASGRDDTLRAVGVFIEAICKTTGNGRCCS
ncbi:MAG: MarR family transcriptional regulator [Smithellaceae bacterium]